MEYLISAMNQLKLKQIEWSNIFKININLEKETYTRSEVIDILNKHDDELNTKYLYYINLIEENHKQHEHNKWSILNWIK